MNKKLTKIAKLPIVLGIIAFIGLGSLITYAATNASDKKANDLQVGILKGDVEEKFPKPNTQIGNNDTKEVKVVNSGNLPLFVRVMVFPEIIASAQNGSKILPANIGQEDSTTNQVIADINETNWKYGEDGYYYYLGKLEKGQPTENLFNTVKIASSVSKEYIGAELNIYIKSETVAVSKIGKNGKAYGLTWWGNAEYAPTVDAQPKLNEVDTVLSKLVE